MPLCKELPITQLQKSPWIPWKSLEVWETSLLFRTRLNPLQPVGSVFNLVWVLVQTPLRMRIVIVPFLCNQGRSVPQRTPTSARLHGSSPACHPHSSASNWPAGETLPMLSTSASQGKRSMEQVSWDPSDWWHRVQPWELAPGGSQVFTRTWLMLTPPEQRYPCGVCSLADGKEWSFREFSKPGGSFLSLLIQQEVWLQLRLQQVKNVIIRC